MDTFEVPRLYLGDSIFCMVARRQMSVNGFVQLWQDFPIFRGIAEAFWSVLTSLPPSPLRGTSPHGGAVYGSPDGAPLQDITQNGDKLQQAPQDHEDMKDAVKPLAPGADAVEDGVQGIGDAAEEQPQKAGAGHHLPGLGDHKGHRPTHEDIADLCDDLIFVQFA